jgi:hypothetical protein
MKHKFENGQHVVVRRMGDSMPGEYPAVVRGIYAGDSPTPSYIVEWEFFSIDDDLNDSLLKNMGVWDCSVVIETCIDAA